MIRPVSDSVLQLSSKVDELGNQVVREAEKTAAVLTRQEEMIREAAAQMDEKRVVRERLAQVAFSSLNSCVCF